MEKTLITIGRQHGSGGTEVAEILAEKLNVWYYNREILYMAADKIGFDSFDEESMKELTYRLKRLAKAEGREVTLEEMRKEDKTRESYYNYYTGQEWGDVRNYDLALNMGKTTAEDAADMILSYIEKRRRSK